MFPHELREPTSVVALLLPVGLPSGSVLVQYDGMADIWEGPILQVANPGMKITGIIGVVSRVKATSLFKDSAPVHDIARWRKRETRVGKVPFGIQPPHQVHEACSRVSGIVAEGSAGSSSGEISMATCFHSSEETGQP